MEISYYLTDGDANKISIIAEKLYQKRFKIGDTVIEWEEFTSLYMKLPIPDITDELGIRKWVDARPSWLRYLNAELLRRNYPMQLFVSPSIGIYVRILKAAITEIARKRIRKNMNVLIKTLNDFEDCKKDKGFVNSIKMLDALITIQKNVVHELSQCLDKTPGISSPIRKELKMIVAKKMPNDNSNLQLPLDKSA